MVIATEVRGRFDLPIRLRRVEDSSADNLLPFVQEAVAPRARGGAIRAELARQLLAEPKTECLLDAEHLGTIAA